MNDGLKKVHFISGLQPQSLGQKNLLGKNEDIFVFNLAKSWGRPRIKENSQPSDSEQNTNN